MSDGINARPGRLQTPQPLPADAPAWKRIADARAHQPPPVWEPIDPDESEPVVVCDDTDDDRGQR